MLKSVTWCVSTGVTRIQMLENCFVTVNPPPPSFFFNELIYFSSETGSVPPPVYVCV